MQNPSLFAVPLSQKSIWPWGENVSFTHGYEGNVMSTSNNWHKCTGKGLGWGVGVQFRLREICKIQGSAKTVKFLLSLRQLGCTGLGSFDGSLFVVFASQPSFNWINKQA